MSQMRRSTELAAIKFQPRNQMQSAWIYLVDLYFRKLATTAVSFGKLLSHLNETLLRGWTRRVADSNKVVRT